ncbi:MAG TPA: T9SS type A sorting domain-containing protein, partial [Chitinophagaceae bacterium]|nr:T9SS type A sorting domain-containing protein [Chitinophagaceae bacterium]
IEAVFFYQLYDNAPLNGGKFNTSGLVNDDMSRRPAADYLYQVNKLLGNYHYKETIHTDPVVDRYSLNGHSAYALVIPDEKGRVANYTLNLGDAASAKIYIPTIGKDSMRVKNVSTVNGKLTVLVTETPIFIIPDDDKISLASRASSEEIAEIEPYKESGANIYPNPTSDFFFIELQNKNIRDVSVNVFAQNGKLCQSHRLKKTSDKLLERISIATLPFGLYLIEIIQDNKKIVKKVIKTYAGTMPK